MKAIARFMIALQSMHTKVYLRLPTDPTQRVKFNLNHAS